VFLFVWPTHYGGWQQARTQLRSTELRLMCTPIAHACHQPGAARSLHPLRTYNTPPAVTCDLTWGRIQHRRSCGGAKRPHPSAATPRPQLCVLSVALPGGIQNGSLGRTLHCITYRKPRPLARDRALGETRSKLYMAPVVGHPRLYDSKVAPAAAPLVARHQQVAVHLAEERTAACLASPACTQKSR